MAGADADKASCAAAAAVAIGQIFGKEGVGVAYAKHFEARSQITIGPVVVYRREGVDFFARIEILALCGNALLISVPGKRAATGWNHVS
jgi:hypothetical protein